MSRIIAPSELQHLGYEELHALFNRISKELNQTAPRSAARRDALASLENIQHAIRRRLGTPHPKPPGF